MRRYYGVQIDFHGFHFAKDFRFFIEIPDSNRDSKRFVLDSGWCRTPRPSVSGKRRYISRYTISQKQTNRAACLNG